MQTPKRSSESVLQISSAREVLHGRCPLVSNAKSKRGDIIVERYAIKGEVTTPRVSFANQHLVAIQWAGKVEESGRSPIVAAPFATSIFPGGLVPSEYTMSEVQFTNLSLDTSFLRRVACEMDLPDRFELIPQRAIRDEQIENIAAAAESEIRSELGVGTLFMESLATALGSHLLARYSSRQVALPECRARMSPTQLRCSTDFIAANLGKELHLSELAANVGLSAHYFCRMFKQGTKLSPHQFVLRKRIEQSQHLLKEHNLPIIEIAAQLGFSDQSHFSRVFRSLVGTTPKRYSAQH